MKRIFFILFAFAIIHTHSQVVIGNDNITSISVSLEFGNDNRGLLLPWVTSASALTGAVNGTIIFDTSDKKIKYKKAGSWFDLSVNNTGEADTNLQNNLMENSTARVTIGKNGGSDTTPGILVLTDTDKAMILPKVASPHLNIISPSAGMMVYDNSAHQLAVFNGSVWSFWKP
ncbi:hypothetical protein HNP38_003181 [Chryseobacterium defluvii]|uniref:Uncharacterized protein n=1 Tax=Chryseobacterium defluvii TaxID=160396 RepID=A0A840KGR2_9FLAO|nr:hypothetical protein [Chryseobacterium defluvii]MBB4807865.1 hypothetical protein [Chryseobacterium defluvii]